MPISAVKQVGEVPVGDLPYRLGLGQEIERLRAYIVDWIEECNAEMQQMLRWQLLARSKYFRPFTIFACHRAVSREPVSAQLLRAAVGLELFHNVSLIIDDIVDHSRHRRGKLTLHCRFGELPALMASGYITAGGFRLAAGDPFTVRLLGELLQRLGTAECVQWRLRRQPLGVEDWRAIAGEDTGSMFEICARLGTRDNRLGNYGKLLGMLYHGCDDVGDVRGLAALGGGGDEDVRDGILTLPVAMAIRDPETAALFRSPDSRTAPELMRRLTRALPEAELYLDSIAREAREEAVANADDPALLLDLIEHTRVLSRS